MSKTITISDETYEKLKDQLIPKEKEEKKIGIEIKTLAGSVLFNSSKTTIKEAVVEAVSEGADFTGANLRGANFTDADLRGADLEGANLRGADLRGAYLTGADFFHTKFYGKGGTTKIKKSQVDDFFKALGVVVEN